jgi:hypothetical protein
MTVKVLFSLPALMLIALGGVSGDPADTAPSAQKAVVDAGGSQGSVDREPKRVSDSGEEARKCWSGHEIVCVEMSI